MSWALVRRSVSALYLRIAHRLVLWPFAFTQPSENSSTKFTRALVYGFLLIDLFFWLNAVRCDHLSVWFDAKCKLHLVGLSSGRTGKWFVWTKFESHSCFRRRQNWCSVSLLRSLPGIWLHGKVLSILSFVHVNWTHFRRGRFCWAPFLIERCWWECSHWKSTYKRGRIEGTTVMKIKLNNRIKHDGSDGDSAHQLYKFYWSAYCDRTMTHLGAVNLVTADTADTADSN